MTAWDADAPCKTVDTERFFYTYGIRVLPLDLRQMCAECPIRLGCLQAGLHEQHGIWGGLTPRQRYLYRRGQRDDHVEGWPLPAPQPAPTPQRAPKPPPTTRHARRPVTIRPPRPKPSPRPQLPKGPPVWQQPRRCHHDACSAVFKPHAPGQLYCRMSCGMAARGTPMKGAA